MSAILLEEDGIAFGGMPATVLEEGGLAFG
jgi:hypothetical protein